MTHIHIQNTNHSWTKLNLVTLPDGSDRYECSRCGIKAKRVSLDTIAFDGRVKNPESCRNPKNVKRIIITNCTANGPQFENIERGSTHAIVDPPEDQKERNPNGSQGYWVMGVSEPVLILFGEFRELSE